VGADVTGNKAFDRANVETRADLFREFAKGRDEEVAGFANDSAGEFDASSIAEPIPLPKLFPLSVPEQSRQPSSFPYCRD
jgi:hypothetical protein